MTTDKARKRAVRTRMEKTGERYAAARRHVVAAHRSEPSLAPVPETEPVATAAATAAIDPPGDPGWTDETIVKGTGRDWAHWLVLLDERGAMDLTHTEIARWLAATQDISGWWAQTVTVGYERARGRRAPHQTTRGFEVSVSKTMRAPADAVWVALTDPERQVAWIDPGVLEPTTARPGVVARFAVAGGPSVVEAVLDAKGPEKTTVTVTARKLADADDVERQRAIWRDRLGQLGLAVASDPVRSS